MRRVDLHCHSTVSDAPLTPAAVVARAAAAGVELLALTDHDEVSGLAGARAAAESAGIRLLNGVEISVTWRERTLHVVGLDIDPESAPLLAGLAGVRRGRAERAERIAAGLAAAGVGGALEGALRFVRNPALVSRTHFARMLVERGVCADVKSVFQRFLVAGRPGHVTHRWAGLGDAVNWIRAAGGVAALAHPGRYGLSGRALRDLLEEFKTAGGAGIEVVTASHSPEQCRRFARVAREFGLLASAGSDFHDPDESVLDFGAMPDLPAGAPPLWERMGWL
jgi:predicted metal-dependent phosphoesterase TrpH